MQHLHPRRWVPAKGFSNGIAVEGRQIFIAGQIGWIIAFDRVSNFRDRFDRDDGRSARQSQQTARALRSGSGSHEGSREEDLRC